MKALTIKQPWANLVSNGIKRIENRTWRPSMKLLEMEELIAIHAGKSIDRRAYDPGMCPISPGSPSDARPLGAIIGVAIIVDVVDESSDPWFIGPLGWILDAIRIKKPIPVRGSLGLWVIPDSIESLIMKQI